jgi:hypothetical protein
MNFTQQLLSTHIIPNCIEIRQAVSKMYRADGYLPITRSLYIYCKHLLKIQIMLSNCQSLSCINRYIFLTNKIEYYVSYSPPIWGLGEVLKTPLHKGKPFCETSHMASHFNIFFGKTSGTENGYEM